MYPFKSTRVDGKKRKWSSPGASSLIGQQLHGHGPVLTHPGHSPHYCLRSTHEWKGQCPPNSPLLCCVGIWKDYGNMFSWAPRAFLPLFSALNPGLERFSHNIFHVQCVEGYKHVMCIKSQGWLAERLRGFLPVPRVMWPGSFSITPNKPYSTELRHLPRTVQPSNTEGVSTGGD